MIKTLALLFTLSALVLAVSKARAESTIFFPRDTAMVLVQGTDGDAQTLFDAMKVDASQTGGVLTKRILLKLPSGDLAFDLACNKAINAPSSSCTFKVYPALAVIDKATKSFLFRVNDPAATSAVAAQFAHVMVNPAVGVILGSTDQRFRLWKTFDAAGEVKALSAQYGD